MNDAPSLCMIFPGNALKLMLTVTDSQSGRHCTARRSERASGAISMGMKIDMNERTDVGAPMHQARAGGEQLIGFLVNAEQG